MIILDASDDDAWATINEYLKKIDITFDMTVMHHASRVSLLRRMAESLPVIKTPYIILAADDDLYFFEWLETAVDLLDEDSSFGVVYGHTLKFQLDKYLPYGTHCKYYIDKIRNPPTRWLEGESAVERLAELGNPDSDLATAGWYALQREDLFKVIVTYAIENHIDLHFFEKFLIFCQASLYKTRMLDDIYLARQVNSDERRPPLSYKTEQEELGRLIGVSAKILIDCAGLDDKTAKRIAEHTFQGEIMQMKRADKKSALRFVADRFPGLRTAWSYLLNVTGYRDRELRFYSTDPRFPPPPEIHDSHPKVKILNQIVCERNV